jgi:hypothetical protein
MCEVKICQCKQCAFRQRIDAEGRAMMVENKTLPEDSHMRAIRSLRGDCADLMAERDRLKAENEALYGLATSAQKCAERMSAALRNLLNQAYRFGWDSSGQGWNGEHPGDAHDLQDWIQERDREISELLGEVRHG